MRDTRSRSVLTMVADLQLTGMDSVQRKLKRLSGDFNEAISFDDKVFVKQWSRARTAVEKSWVQTMMKAAEASFNPGALRKISQQYETSMGRVDEARLRVEKLITQYRERQAKGLETRTLKEEIQREKRHIASLQKGFDAEMSHIRDAADKRRDAVEETNRMAKRTASEAAEEFGSSFSEQFDRLRSGDFANFLKSAGKRFQVASVQASRRAGEGGPSQKTYEGLSTVLGKLGGAAIALGAVVAGFAALAKVVMDADSKAKDLNKTLLESGVAAGDLTLKYEDFGDSIDRVRRTFAGSEGSFDFNRIWGTDAKDHLQILGAYAEAGVSMRKLAAGAKDASDEMSRYREASAHALTYSKLLGVSANEIATQTSGYMEDLGLSLKGVQGRFSELELAARESGFGTKRFFSTVIQATSGLTGYNVRLSQSASLLKSLGKVLGVKAGGELLSQLQRGFGEEGYMDRYRRLMITGGKVSGQVFEQSAKDSVTELARVISESPEIQQATIRKVLSSFGIDIGGKGAVAQLGKLSAGQQARLLDAARLEGVSDELVRSLRETVQVSRGARGGIATRAGTLESIGAGGTLAMKMLEAQNLLGPLHELTGPQRGAAESITGVSGEQFSQLVQLSERFFSMDQRLSEVQKGLKGGAAFDTQLAEKMAREYGVYVDREGKRRRVLVEKGATFTPGMGEEIGNSLTEILTSHGKEFAKIAEEQVPRDIQLAQEMVQNTSEMSKILEQGVEYWLEQIYSAVQGIFTFLGSKTDQKNRMQAIESLTQDINKTHAMLDQQERDLSQLVKQARTASKADQPKLAADIAAKRETALSYKGKLSALTKVRSNLISTPAEFNLIDAKTAEQYQHDALVRSKQNMIEAARKAGVTGTPEEVLSRIGMSSFFPSQVPMSERSHTAGTRVGGTVVNNYHMYNRAEAIERALAKRDKFARP